ncbi:MAG: hypothetical protein GY928_21610 [Colwellia sp.]|nr:hypothetical protein [Colwellia sp.]
MGDPSTELRATYIYTPAVKGDLETEPTPEEYEVIRIEPILSRHASNDCIASGKAYEAARRAMKMYVDGGCDQFHSVLRNLK